VSKLIIVQHPVGIDTQAPLEDLSTGAGKKAAVPTKISALQGQAVIVTAGQSQQLEWKVIHPLI
jgi:hypothetical protein